MDLPGPTDVMSFPMDELEPGGRPDAPEPGPSMLGDIVLCPEFAAEQAAAAGHSLGHELALLTIHGVLHLLGYDHAEQDEEKEMFALQAGYSKNGSPNRSRHIGLTVRTKKTASCWTSQGISTIESRYGGRLADLLDPVTDGFVSPDRQLGRTLERHRWKQSVRWLASLSQADLIFPECRLRIGRSARSTP